MAWRVFGERYETADASNTRVFQPVIFNDDIVLKGCRTWLILIGDATLTSVSMSIFSNVDGIPGNEIFTSTNTLTKAEIITEDNGVKEVFFDWADLSLKGTETFHFLLRLNGYTGAELSHLAWMRAFPDPVYAPTPALTYVQLGVAPFQLYFIAAEL